MPTQYTTSDYNQGRLNQLKTLFPDLFTTEGQLDKSELAKLAVLNDPNRISTHDRYSFAWSGKTLAKQHAFAPSLATLTHDKERSYTQNSPSQNKTPDLDTPNSPSMKGWQSQTDGVVPTTQEHLPAVGGTPLGEENYSPSMKGWQSQTGGVVQSNPHIIIEGENLEVLKQLQSAYYEQIKCIYIDPPYNTGKDFVYSDNFTQGKQAYWQESGQTDEYGVKITTNTESSGRYHSDWLSMIYSRLLLARQLLTDDGVIFVSIDDNEVHNLRKVMDEVFGEENFVAQLPTIMNLKGNQDEFGFAGTHEYTVVFAKNKELLKLGEFDIDEENIDDWEEDERGYFKKGAILKRTGADAPREKRPNGWFPVYITKNDKVLLERQSEDDVEIFPITNGQEMSWRWSKNKMIEENDDIIVVRNGGISLYKKQRPQLGELPTKKPKSTFYKPEYSSGNGTNEFNTVLDVNFGSSMRPKPLSLIKDIVKISTNPNSLILDFFAGSGTTGQAVMELNEADGGNRQCILVQMPELTDERSEAYKAGYKRISDITIERNKRVIQGYGKKNPVATQQPLNKGQLGFNAGFEVFRLEQSNFPVNQWRPDPELEDDQNVVEFEKYVLAKEASLFSELDPIKAVLEIAIKEGLKLDYTQIILKDFRDNQVLQLTDKQKMILICLDSEIKPETVELLSKSYKESKFICLERAIDTTAKWNLNHNLGVGFKAI